MQQLHKIWNYMIELFFIAATFFCFSPKKKMEHNCDDEKKSYIVCVCVRFIVDANRIIAVGKLVIMKLHCRRLTFSLSLTCVDCERWLQFNAVQIGPIVIHYAKLNFNTWSVRNQLEWFLSNLIGGGMIFGESWTKFTIFLIISTENLCKSTNITVLY